jgi:glutathione S-transferase
MGCSSSKSANVVAKPETGAVTGANMKEKCQEPKPILYWFRGSPPSSATHEIALMCLGKDGFDTREVDLFKGENKAEAYLKINASGKVPALTHGDFQISESRAIQQLIVRHSKKCELLGGADLKSQAKVQQAMYYEAGNVNTKIVSFVVPVIFGGELDAEKMKETLMPVFAAVDTMLSESKFMGGDCMSIVDINMVHNLGLFSLLGEEKVKNVFEHHKNICEWFKNVMLCEEYKKCVECIAEAYPGGQSEKVLNMAKVCMEC